jgi:anti-sigma-K factor RskA
MGELSALERAEFEKNLQQFAELQQELKKVEETQQQLLTRLSVSPPSNLKASIFKKIEQSDNVRPIGTSGSNFWKLAAAASVTLAVVAGVLAIHYRNKWKASDSDFRNLQAQNERIAQDYNNVNQRLDKIENDIRVFENPDFIKVVMKGTQNSPQSMASVYWNEETHEVYLGLENMKELSAQNQYQLWAIIDGKPVDAGVFDGNVTGLSKMKNIAGPATTFAVTIEPRGGKSTPTLETMQVAGTVIRG